VRLDHLLSKEHVALVVASACARPFGWVAGVAAQLGSMQAARGTVRVSGGCSGWNIDRTVGPVGSGCLVQLVVASSGVGAGGNGSRRGGWLGEHTVGS
jgi:hypothetical protein